MHQHAIPSSLVLALLFPLLLSFFLLLLLRAGDGDVLELGLAAPRDRVHRVGARPLLLVLEIKRVRVEFEHVHDLRLGSRKKRGRGRARRELLLDV